VVILSEAKDDGIARIDVGDRRLETAWLEHGEVE